MNGILGIFPPGDRWIFLAWILLCVASLALLWSVTEPIVGPYDQSDPGVDKGVFYRQAVWILISFAALTVISRVPLRHLDQIALPVFLFSLLLLILILIAGPKIGGARRWLALGPLRLQPSELAKVAFILVNAHLLARSAEEGRSLAATALSFGVMAVPMILILREPDLGTSLVFLAVWVGMVFWYGIPGILLLGSGSALSDEVMVQFTNALDAIAHLAEVENAVFRLASEVRRTQRRVNALSKIFIPDYEETIDYIEDVLEERERESFVIMKMAKARLESNE